LVLTHDKLQRRSATLRTYAGDTSLPGGRVDPEDATVEDTAVSGHHENIVRCLTIFVESDEKRMKRCVDPLILYA
jgi:hypothetical protein